jgi:Fe2+ or Zn2+ uptake regulation protein
VSQELVYKLLKELGGVATTKQVREKAQQEYPDLTLYKYVFNRLKKLEKNGYISRSYKNSINTWTIIAIFP